jgi:predicted RND superfamily exporter protein
VSGAINQKGVSFAMKRTFFARYALLVLCVIVFMGPFALRGARMAMQRMTNRVKDWLPADFPETADLEWFGRHFMGEQFIILTWPGCSEEDPRYRKLLAKLQNEVVPPAKRTDNAEQPATEDPADRKPFDQLTPEEKAELDRQRARALGDALGLCTISESFENWGGRQEKWVPGDRDLWYFITPDGKLYRWHGRNNMLGWLQRTLQRSVFGKRTAEGEFVASFGQPSAPGRPNEFHADPRKLNARFFTSVESGPETLKQLSRKEGPLWPRGVDDEFAAKEAAEKALERLKGTMFGPDGKQTCMLVTLSEPAKRDLRRVIGRPLMGRPRGRLLEIAQVECGIGEEELKLGGPPVDNVAIDEEGQITLARLILFSAVIGIGLSLFMVQSIRITAMLFFIGGLSAISSVAIVFWSGGTVDAIMMSMPSLVYVLGMSGALHLVNYYREVVEEQGLIGAPEKMLSLGWKATVLCATTNSIGLLSLYTSSLVPIRNFGTYSAVGVVSTLLLFFTFLPAALQLWPPRQPPRKKPDEAHPQPTTFERRLHATAGRAGEFFVRRWGLVTAACVAVIGFASLGVFKIHTSVHLIKFFDEDSKIIRDYTWLEDHLAKLVPMELVVRVRPEMMRSSQRNEAADGEAPDVEQERFGLNFLERMEIAARVQDVVERELGEKGQGIVGRAMSAPTFAPDLPPPGLSTLRNPVRSVMNRKLEEARDEYIAADLLRVEQETPNQGSELWRISLRVGALREIDYGQFVGELRRVVEPVLAAYHYRQQILHDVDEQREGQGFVKSRVAFLGFPDTSDKAPQRQPDADKSGGTGESTGEQGIEQTKIFAKTLQDLMLCAGVRGKTSDPAKADVERDFYTSQAWADWLSKDTDCVVLVQDNPAYDIPFVRKHARLFIDARDHRFDAASTPSPTALQRKDPIHVVYTGVVPLVYKAQRSLLESLIQSTFWSFITITPLMMFLARSIPAGIVVMLPNALPVMVIFGGMGWLGIDVDVGSMMTASIALGVAVDDTIHYLTWFRDDLDQLGDRHAAIIASYKRCALPTLQAAAISGLGLSVFALSTFTPTQRFGYMMLTILFAGVVAELVMLPALLAGPLGRFCAPRKPRQKRDAADKSPPAADTAPPAEDVVEAQPAESGFATAHITGKPPSRRDSRVLRHDRGHERK